MSDLKIKEMTQLIVEGKVGINELMKSLVDSIVPVKKTRKQYIRNGKPKMTDEERREYQKQYQKQYYEKSKEKRAQEYEQNKEILNKNQRKYYKIRVLCKELEELRSRQGEVRALIEPTLSGGAELRSAKGEKIIGAPIREFRKKATPLKKAISEELKEN